MMEGPPQPEEEKVQSQEQEPQPEQEKDLYEGLTEEQREMAQAFLPGYQEVETAPEAREDHTEKSAALEQELADFESGFDLEALHAITDLTPEEAPNHPIREPARKALESISYNLDTLKKKTNITPEAYAALKQRYARLSQAVGMINNNTVDHTR